MDVRVGDWVRWDWDGDLARPVYARVRAIRYERRRERVVTIGGQVERVACDTHWVDFKFFRCLTMRVPVKQVRVIRRRR